MNLKETYNKIAPDWHKEHQENDTWWVDGTKKFVSFLKQGDLVLDVGCGGGVKSKFLYDRGLEVVGIDFSEKLIEIARKENQGIEFIVMDMYDTGKLPYVFDGVFAQASLLHIPKKDLHLIIRTITSHVKNDGVIYIAVKGILPGGPSEEIKKENNYGYPYERFFSYYSMDELVDALEVEGLQVVYQDTKKTGRSEWLQIIGKKK